MASLDIMEVKGTTTEKSEMSSDNIIQQSSRLLRKRKSVAVENKSLNRRVSMKPRKRLVAECASTKQIEALYLNKTTQSTSNTLETIFEEPKTENNENQTKIGGRKIKRLLTFPLGSQYTKDKIKKRRAKIKKFLGNKFLNRKKIPMQVFLNTIDSLELDE